MSAKSLPNSHGHFAWAETCNSLLSITHELNPVHHKGHVHFTSIQIFMPKAQTILNCFMPFPFHVLMCFGFCNNPHLKKSCPLALTLLIPLPNTEECKLLPHRTKWTWHDELEAKEVLQHGYRYLIPELKVLKGRENGCFLGFNYVHNSHMGIEYTVCSKLVSPFWSFFLPPKVGILHVGPHHSYANAI